MMFHRDFSENYNESMFLLGNFACFSSGCMLTFSPAHELVQPRLCPVKPNIQHINQVIPNFNRKIHKSIWKLTVCDQKKDSWLFPICLLYLEHLKVSGFPSSNQNFSNWHHSNIEAAATRQPSASTNKHSIIYNNFLTTHVWPNCPYAKTCQFLIGKGLVDQISQRVPQCPTLLHSWSILKFWLGLPTCHGGKDFGSNVTWPDGGSPEGKHHIWLDWCGRLAD